MGTLLIGVMGVTLGACAPTERSSAGLPERQPIPADLSRAALEATLGAAPGTMELVSADIDGGKGVELARVILRQAPPQVSYELRYSATCSRLGGARWQCAPVERSALIKGAAPFIDTAIHGIDDVPRAVALRDALIDKLSKTVWYLSVCDADSVLLFDANDARNLRAVSMARGDVVAQFARKPRQVAVKLDPAALEDPPVLKPVCAYEVVD